MLIVDCKNSLLASFQEHRVTWRSFQPENRAKENGGLLVPHILRITTKRELEEWCKLQERET